MTLQDFNSLTIWVLGGIFVALIIGHVVLTYLDKKDQWLDDDEESKWDY